MNNHRVKVKVVHNEGSMSLLQGRNKVSSINFVVNEESKSIDINHCYTVKKYRGKGFAAILLKEMVQYCDQREMKVVPICSYAKENIPKLVS